MEAIYSHFEQITARYSGKWERDGYQPGRMWGDESAVDQVTQAIKPIPKIIHVIERCYYFCRSRNIEPTSEANFLNRSFSDWAPLEFSRVSSALTCLSILLTFSDSLFS